MIFCLAPLKNIIYKIYAKSQIKTGWRNLKYDKAMVDNKFKSDHAIPENFIFTLILSHVM